MQEKKKINIGLDIGIASVGWAVSTHDKDNFEIIDSGVRLFSSLDADGLKNEDKRRYRGSRRLIRRKKNIKKLFIKFLLKNKVIHPFIKEKGKLIIDKSFDENKWKKDSKKYIEAFVQKYIIDFEKNFSKRWFNPKENLVNDYISNFLPKFLVNKLEEKLANQQRDNSKFQQHKLSLKQFMQQVEIPSILDLIKIKGIKHKLEESELIFLMYGYLKKKGLKLDKFKENKDFCKASSSSSKIKVLEKINLIKQLMDKDEEDPEKQNTLVDSINYELEKNDLTPIELKIELVWINNVDSKNFNKFIKNKDYVKEINKIFSNQQKLVNLKNEFIEIFKMHRSFEKGPGPSMLTKEQKKFFKKYPNFLQYSRFKDDLDNPYSNIWEATIGECSLFESKDRKKIFRAPKNTFSAEIFNFLNDLNNIFWMNNITGEANNKLSVDDKKRIIEILINPLELRKIIKLQKSTNLDLKEEHGPQIKEQIFNWIKEWKNLSNVTFCNLEKVTPLRTLIKYNDSVNKENKISAKQIFKWIDKINKTNNQDEIKIDEMFKQMCISIFKKNQVKEIQKVSVLSEEEIIRIVCNFNDDDRNGSHSYSLEALQSLIPFLFYGKNNSEIVIKSDDFIQKIDKRNFKLKTINIEKNSKFLNLALIDEIIISPSAKRGLRQAFKIVNEILRVYVYTKKYNLNNFYIETAKNLSTKQSKKNEIDFNRERNETKKQSQKIIVDNNLSDNQKMREKIELWREQNEYCPYTLTKISIGDIDNNKVEIDHIVPTSFVNINAKYNKVLCFKWVNQQKLNRQPFRLFEDKNFKTNLPKEMQNKINKWRSEVYSKLSKSKTPKSRKYLKKKLDFLSMEIDLSEYENRRKLGFAERNLVDTRYIAKSITKIFQAFFSKMNNVRIVTINPKLVSYTLKKLIYGDQLNNYDKKSIPCQLLKSEHITDEFKKRIINIKLINNQKLPIKDISAYDIASYQKNKQLEVDSDFEKWEKKRIIFKNRVWHGHHAQDAIILSSISFVNPTWDNSFNYFFNYKDRLKEEKEKKREWYWGMQKGFIKTLRENMNKNLSKINFSVMTQRKGLNSKLFGDTLYRGNIYKELEEDEEKQYITQIKKKIKILELSEKEWKEYFQLEICKKNNCKWRNYMGKHEFYFDKEKKKTLHPKKAVKLDLKTYKLICLFYDETVKQLIEEIQIHNKDAKRGEKKNFHHELIKNNKVFLSKDYLIINNNYKKPLKIKYLKPINHNKTELEKVFIPNKWKTKRNKISYFSNKPTLWIDLFQFPMLETKRNIVLKIDAMLYDVICNKKFKCNCKEKYIKKMKELGFLITKKFIKNLKTLDFAIKTYSMKF